MEKVVGIYKYYSGCGVYRSDGEKVEFYSGNGKWEVVDYDIDEALRWDDSFMEITTQSSLDYQMKHWDESAD